MGNTRPCLIFISESNLWGNDDFVANQLVCSFPLPIRFWTCSTGSPAQGRSAMSRKPHSSWQGRTCHKVCFPLCLEKPKFQPVSPSVCSSTSLPMMVGSKKLARSGQTTGIPKWNSRPWVWRRPSQRLSTLKKVLAMKLVGGLLWIPGQGLWFKLDTKIVLGWNQ